MEEFMKLVNANIDIDNDVSSSDTENESESFGQPEHKEPVAEGGKRKTGTARLPTRRPDPNIYNRNALLARENRRKKKAHMEAVERQLEEMRVTNRSLLKALKKQFKLSHKLENECKSLKDMLRNYKSQKDSSPDNRAASPEGSLISTYSTSSCSYEQPMDSRSTFPGLQILDADNDYQHNDNSSGFLEEHNFDKPLKPLEISDEHSYFNKFAEIGFSPNCEWSPSRTPPTQLLQADDILISTSSEYIASL